MTSAVNPALAGIALPASLGIGQPGYATTPDRASPVGIQKTADASAISSPQRAPAGGMMSMLRHLNDGISIVQTADAGLDRMTEVLQRAREAVAGGVSVDAETRRVAADLDGIAADTTYGGVTLLSGPDAGQPQSFPAGIAGETISIAMGEFTAATLSLGEAGSAESVVAAIDSAIERISAKRAELGDAQAHFGAAITAALATNTRSAAGLTSESAARTATEVAQQLIGSFRSQATASPQFVGALLK